MKISLQILAMSFLLFSCKQEVTELKQESDKSEVLIKPEENSVSANEEIINNSTDDIKIKFPDLTISMKDIEMGWEDEYNPNDNIYETKEDTAFFKLYPGDFMFEKSFSIEQTEYDELELYGQTEIKVGIDSKREIDVPFCVLEDWKSYTSEWSKLKINEKDLKFPIIEEEEADPPINFTIDELKLAVEKNCGLEWFNEIRETESLDELPTSFFTTKYVYKIRVRNTKTNQTIEKFIVFYTPTSC